MSSEVAGVNRTRQHATDVDTPIDVWVPHRTTLLPYIRPRSEMITFSIIFGLFPVVF